MATTQPSQWLPLNEFTASVRTGQSQAEAALGMSFFDYLEQHPSQAREFSAGVASTTALWSADAARVIDTTGVKLAVDVGGATGSLLHLLQLANPTLRGIIFDRPNIVDDAVAHTARRAPRGQVFAVHASGTPPASTHCGCRGWRWGTGW